MPWKNIWIPHSCLNWHTYKSRTEVKSETLTLWSVKSRDGAEYGFLYFAKYFTIICVMVEKKSQPAVVLVSAVVFCTLSACADKNIRREMAKHMAPIYICLHCNLTYHKGYL